MPDEQVNQEVQEQQVQQEVQKEQQQTSDFDTLMAQKGFKSPEDVAKSYREAESTLHRTQNLHSTVKQQLEAHGYTVDEKGNIVSVNQDPYNQQGQYQQPGQQYQQGQYQPQGEPIYDPYSGQQLTNPLDIQLAQLPPSQRTAVVVNAIIEQREKQQNESFVIEQEVLSLPEAKGFENDVKRVMMKVPLAQRVNKEAWKDALLKVKGMKYDEAIKGAGQQGVDNFLNKERLQTVSATSGGDRTVKLTPEQETTYQFYAENHPGMFKDRASFAKRLQNTG